MATPVTFDFSLLVKRHAEIAVRADDLSPTMQIIAQQLVGIVHETWDTEGRGEWPALAPSTIARKGHDLMLIETGEGYVSVAAESGPQFASAGSTVGHLKYHLGDGPRTKIPKRDPFEVPLEELDESIALLLAALVKG